MRVGRLETITKMLEAQGNVEVSRLSALLNVTEKTIRQDLTQLETMGIAVRVHGGALPKSEQNEIYPISFRKRKYMAEKQRIALKALSLIEDGDIIILDSGTTTLELAKRLDKSVIVITNDPLISHTLLYHDKVTLFSTGGKLSRNNGSFSYISSDVIRMLNHYHAHKCFLGTSALDFEQGLMVFSSEESDIKQTIMKSSDQTICLIDYSKFHQTAFSSYAKLSELDSIVTDDRIAGEDVARLEALGIRVLIS